MKRLIIVLLLTVLLMSSFSLAARDDDEDIYSEFQKFIREVYMSKVVDDMWHANDRDDEIDGWIEDPNGFAAVLGYAIYNLDQKFSDGTEEHEKILKALKKGSEAHLRRAVEMAASRKSLFDDEKEEMEMEVLFSFLETFKGRRRGDMALLTGIRKDDAPNFFLTLGENMEKHWDDHTYEPESTTAPGLSGLYNEETIKISKDGSEYIGRENGEIIFKLDANPVYEPSGQFSHWTGKYAVKKSERYGGGTTWIDIRVTKSFYENDPSNYWFVITSEPGSAVSVTRNLSRK